MIDMCVRMLNPKRNEYVMDPACGSAGFLVHAMEWAYPAKTPDEMELRKSRYASRYLWGIDFEEQAAKTSRALMLIAGDGHANIFGPDVDTLEPRTWYRTPSGKQLMERLKQFNLTKKTIPNDELLNDDEKAWEYFEELKFDVILSNPPFAGEVKVKQQLAQYELAKPALKRAQNKQAKEERDVLFIERIIKMLKPGGRAAIVLPQGKFNNSSLAFIREWILRKARLLAVVGLHQNTFKPHTGTKTSVLFIQKYTEEELKNIERVQNEVKAACPDYSAQIRELLTAHENEIDIPEEEIPENILELILEEFEEPEPEIAETEDEATDTNSIEEEENTLGHDLGDLLEEANNKIENLKAELLKAKQQLVGLKDAKGALDETQKSEITIITEQWTGTKAELQEHLKSIKEAHKKRLNKLKEEQKEKEKQLKALIKQLENEISQAEHEKNLLTNKGKLMLILQDDELLQKLADRFVDAEVAKRLDYPIFMAVSEEGGKNNSGEYEYLTDEDGNILEDENGNPLIKQDLVNYNITKEELEAMNTGARTTEENLSIAAEPTDEYKVKGKELAIAEAFVKFAKEQGLNFWR